MRLVSIRTKTYNKEDFGLFQAARTRVRVRFIDEATGKHPNVPFTALRILLPDVYQQMVTQPHAPIPMPERIDAEWVPDDDGGYFRLKGKGLAGFSTEATVRLEETWGEVR